MENIIYADATIEIDIQKLVDYIKELEEKIHRLENSVQDLDAIVGNVDIPDLSEYALKEELPEEIKSILREDVTISVEIDC